MFIDVVDDAAGTVEFKAVDETLEVSGQRWTKAMKKKSSDE